MTMTHSNEVTSLVALMPCPFVSKSTQELEETHAEYWQEEARYTLEQAAQDDESGIFFTGQVSFEGDERLTLQLIIEEPLEGIETLSATSAEPLSATEIVLLKQHRSIWRVQATAGRKMGRLAAKRVSQVMGTLIDAGASAAFMPGILRLHSTRFLRKQTMDLYSPSELANLFVGAWHDGEGWMRTRGLTAFGLPELETSTKGGMNGAYFLLMDVAANMLFQMAPYPDGAQLQVGPHTYTFISGPMSTQVEDDEVPINGIFGVNTIIK